MRSKSDEAPHRAELLLQHMLRLYEFQSDSWYIPREIHMRFVMTCWLERSGEGRRYDSMSGKNMYPAEHCENLVAWLHGRAWFDEMSTSPYAMAMRCWAIQHIPTDNEDEPNPVQHVAKLLDRYAEKKPKGELLSAFPCNWVLQTCGRVQPNVERRKEAYNVAINTFKRCKQNARSYTLLIDVLRTQTLTFDEEHLSVIEDLFKQCCARGMLTQDMVERVVAHLPPETLQRLFGLSYQMAELLTTENADGNNTSSPTKHSDNANVLHVRNLPPEWSENADSRLKSKPDSPDDEEPNEKDQDTGD